LTPHGFCDTVGSMCASQLEQIASHLTTRWLGRPVHHWPTIGSTMDAARSLAEEGAPEGTLVIADEQTAGRGRLQRAWWAPAGSSLLITLVLRPELAPRQVQRLTMVCSLAVCDAIAQVCHLEAQIKWPNDVLIAGKKVCGILTELGLLGVQLQYALVGIGINVNVDLSSAPPMMVPATSLIMETGRPVPRTDLLVALLSSIERRYELLRDGHSFHHEWARRLATIGQEVVATSNEERWSGLAVSVDQDGALLIRLENGAVQRVLAADVTLREHKPC
jgi:BirA family biotin operon repressor/biotin-[acetyl-CoA-carboxylase] ligase